MTPATDKLLELKAEIHELTSAIIDCDDPPKIGRLRSVLTAKRQELAELRRRTKPMGETRP